jgi:hypothetical protein
MKSLMLVAAFAGAIVTTSAFAQTAPSQTTQPATSTQVAMNNTATAFNNDNGAWVAPYGQPVHQKTRAEVYHELVHAEQDGQLAYLNSTLYAH